MLGWSLLGGLSELAWRRVRTADALSRRKHLAYDCCWEVAARAKYSGRRETVTVRGITYTEFQGFPDLPGVVWCARVLSGCKSTTGATLLFGCWVSALPLPSKLSELRYTSNTSILQCRTLVHLKMGRIINTCKHLNVLRFLGCGAWVDLGRESHEFHLVQVAPNRLAQSLVFCYFHNGVMGDGVQSKMSGRLSLKKKKNKKPTIRELERQQIEEAIRLSIEEASQSSPPVDDPQPSIALSAQNPSTTGPPSTDPAFAHAPGGTNQDDRDARSRVDGATATVMDSAQLSFDKSADLAQDSSGQPPGSGVGSSGSGERRASGGQGSSPPPGVVHQRCCDGLDAAPALRPSVGSVGVARIRRERGARTKHRARGRRGGEGRRE
eukprot:1136989-Prorocentrum_minimum.AAC.1